MLKILTMNDGQCRSDFYGPFGFLNSQVGEATYIDHLLDVPTELGPKSEPQSQEVGSLDACKYRFCEYVSTR
jgi:hypothetical protein